MFSVYQKQKEMKDDGESQCKKTVLKKIWPTFNVPQGVEKQLQRICGNSPVCRGWHCESAGAAGSAYRWGAGANIYLSVWHAEYWGRPRAEGCKDRGNTKMSVRLTVGANINSMLISTFFCCSSGHKCWAKWPQFCKTHPATQLKKWRWRPELWQDSPSGRMSSVPPLKYKTVALWHNVNIISKITVLTEIWKNPHTAHKYYPKSIWLFR